MKRLGWMCLAESILFFWNSVASSLTKDGSLGDDVPFGLFGVGGGHRFTPG